MTVNLNFRERRGIGIEGSECWRGKIDEENGSGKMGRVGEGQRGRRGERGERGERGRKGERERERMRIYIASRNV